ncbi:MAG: iron ABC transporter permease [Chloroflexi bacterium]|nr:iron ABC transporter permease [Chloroflexota bacterium]
MATSSILPNRQVPPATRLPPRSLLVLGLPICLGALLLAMLTSIAFGAAEINATTVWQAIVNFNPENTNHLIIQTLRMPRAVTAALVGAALAVAGAIMQGLTRNPLADPGLLGIEAGAAFAVVGAVFLFQINSLGTYAVFAFAGGGLTAIAVYGLGSAGHGGPTPLKLTLAGAAISALLSSLTTAIMLFNQRTLEEVRFWLVGSVAGRDFALIGQALPYLVIGLGLALVLGRQITTLNLGDDIAKGLGQSTVWIKTFSAIAVVLLAGVSVALAGPIGFVGLVIPHVVRFFVGVDYRWIVPYSMLIGGTFLVLCDVIGRVVARPSELAVGVMTALIGGPVFIALVRWKVKR